MIAGYAAMIAGLFLICFTCYIWACWYIGCCIMNVALIVQFMGIVTTGINRYNDEGSRCASMS